MFPLSPLDVCNFALTLFCKFPFLEELKSHLQELDARLQRLEARNELEMTPNALSTNEKMGDETVATKVAELPNVEIKMDAVSFGETAQSSEDFRLGSWSEKEISRNFDLYFWKKTLVLKVISCLGQLHFCYSMGHSPNSPGIRGACCFFLTVDARISSRRAMCILGKVLGAFLWSLV